jgi:hypothetical protein
MIISKSTLIVLVVVANGLMASRKKELQLYNSEFKQFPSN